MGGRGPVWGAGLCVWGAVGCVGWGGVCVWGGGDAIVDAMTPGEKFNVKFDVTVFDVTVFDVPVFDGNSSSRFVDSFYFCKTSFWHKGTKI